MADKGHGVKLENMPVETLVELRTDLITELRSRLATERAKAEAAVRSIEAALGESGSRPASNGKRTRATGAEVEARKAAVLAALKGTAKGKGLAKSEIASKAGLEPAAVQQVLGKLKASKTIKMEGERANAQWFLA